MNTAEAQEVLADLEQKHAAALARQAEAATERRRISFDAHTGDAAARAKLDELNGAGAVLTGEIASLAEAIDEARGRVSEARRTDALAAERDVARDVRKKAAAFRRHGAELDRLAARLVVQYDALKAEAGAIRDIGVPLPGLMLINAGACRALQAALMNTGLDIERIAPSQRHTFTELVGGWVESAERWATARLGEPAQ
jgi:hypothetical protein